jgi:hypothetical protein
MRVFMAMSRPSDTLGSTLTTGPALLILAACLFITQESYRETQNKVLLCRKVAIEAVLFLVLTVAMLFR